MKSKIYSKVLNSWSIHKIPIQKGRLGEYRLAVRDLDGKWSKSGGEPVFLLSNQNSKFNELESKLLVAEKVNELKSKLLVAEKAQVSIIIEFVRKYSHKIIQNVL